MRILVSAALLCLAPFLINQSAMAQMPTPTKEHELLKKDVGTWKASVKSWMGETGVLETPEVSEGKETNSMLGDFWLVSDFECQMGGMEFKGHSIIGYETKAKVYRGNWIDSFSNSPTRMTGTYDAETKTMTWEAISMGPNGKPVKMKQVQVYESENKRSFTMYTEVPDQKEMVKAMEIVYTRAK